MTGYTKIGARRVAGAWPADQERARHTRLGFPEKDIK